MSQDKGSGRVDQSVNHRIYDRPYQTIDEQISILKNRGLSIPDDNYAKIQLRVLGYQRVAEYLAPFLQIGGPANDKIRIGIYNPKSIFDFGVMLHDFDRTLRSHISKGLDIIELHTRVNIALVIGSHGMLSYRDPSIYDPSYSENSLKSLIARMDANSLRHNNEMYQSFWKTYEGMPKNELPIWFSIESWDFGTISNCYSNLLYKYRETISSEYNISVQTLSDWLKCLNYVRNCCAHHNRVWNHPLTYTQPDPRMDDFDHCNLSRRKIYYMLCVIAYMLSHIDLSQRKSWVRGLINIADNFPVFYTGSKITLHQAGFPDRWKTSKLWS